MIGKVIAANPDAVMIVKSTVPVGFTEHARAKYTCDNILFSPEFLREGRALYDNLYPSRIVMGVPVKNARLKKAAEGFVSLLTRGALKEDIEIRYMNPTEAEEILRQKQNRQEYAVTRSMLARAMVRLRVTRQSSDTK